jgi:hypothetical protein
LSPAPELCPCGQPLHYTDPKIRAYVEGMIGLLGPTVLVRVGYQVWKGPRRYIALHGLRAVDLRALGFERVSSVGH